MGDYPIEECIKTASDLVRRGHDIHQKFTCEHCGARQTIAEKNQFFTEGHCEECDHVTDIRKKGCNYVAILRLTHTKTGEVHD